jgi:hypothetical protein
MKQLVKKKIVSKVKNLALTYSKPKEILSNVIFRVMNKKDQKYKLTNIETNN